MFVNRLLLVLGSLALLAGVGLSLVVLRMPSPEAVERAAQPRHSVLVAAGALAVGSLLRPGDLRWQESSAATLAPGAFLRGTASESDFVGAAVRRELRPGEPLTADDIVKPTEAGFLRAALAAGKRAMSISVDAVEANSGLILPGDRVDVLLSQNFSEPGVHLANHSAVETVLRDLRVIAVDQTVTAAHGPGEAQPWRPSDMRIPRTVTLEVSGEEAQTLMLAGQLGKLQLTLRGLGDGARPMQQQPAPPTWAGDVSSALRAVDRRLAADAAAPAAISGGSGGGAVVDVIRGNRIERHCFDRLGRMSPECSASEAIPPTPLPSAASPGSGATRAAAPAS